MPSIRYTPNNPGGQLVDDPLDGIETGNRNAAMQAAQMNGSFAMNNALTQQAMAALKERGYEFGQGRADQMAMFREGLARDTQRDQLNDTFRNNVFSEGNARYQDQWNQQHKYDDTIDPMVKTALGSMGSIFGGGGGSAAPGGAPGMPAHNPFDPVAAGASPDDLKFDMPADGSKPSGVVPAAASAPAGGMDLNKLRSLAVMTQMIGALRGGGGGNMQIPDFELQDAQRDDMKRSMTAKRVTDDIAGGNYDAARADSSAYPGTLPQRDPTEVAGEPDVMDAERRMMTTAKLLKDGDTWGGGFTQSANYKALLKAVNDGVEAMRSKLVNPGKARAYFLNKLSGAAPQRQLGLTEHSFVSEPNDYLLGNAVAAGLPAE